MDAERGMPSIKIKPSLTFDLLAKSVIMILCTTLVACGGGSSNTTRISSDEDITEEQKDPNSFTLTVRMPMQLQHAALQIQILGEDELLYENKDFGFTNNIPEFDVAITKLSRNKYFNKIAWIKVTGDKNSRMYDIVSNQFVPFDGEMNALIELNGNNAFVSITPASEAVFQRSLVRAGNIDMSKPDAHLIKKEHLDKAKGEINSSLSGAFNASQFPKFNTSQSIALLHYNQNSEQIYINTFTGIGLLHMWAKEQPQLSNPYLSMAKNLAIDLRDGYLDGRSIAGDKTEFIAFNAVKNTPKNIDVEKNNLKNIGELQYDIRQAFGEQIKEATLDYANASFQMIRNPAGMYALEKNNYYLTDNINNNFNRYRWNGAGDYRPAFGIKSNDNTTSIDNACQPMPPYPCKQGLNADDIGTYYSDIEYLIGTHQVGECKIEMFPNGDVRLTKGADVIQSSINRDMSDNLQQINLDNKHYVLNIGAGEKKPPHFMQLEIQDVQITQARIGSTNDNFYPDLKQLENISLSCR